METQALVTHLSELLQPQRFSDYCPNGLQVQGKSEIKTIVTGVTACQALLDEAVKLKACAVLVHHGLFWKGDDYAVTGMRKRRLKTLLTNDINLFGYHLPLDAHPTLGNNAQLAKLLGIEVTGPLDDEPMPIGNIGQFDRPLTVQEVQARLKQHLQSQPIHIPGQSKTIHTIAWCTGAAQGFIDKAIASGVDAYITGEVSEPTVHTAREEGIHFFAAGHHATERYGIKALGEHLAEQFGLAHTFVDIDNPV